MKWAKYVARMEISNVCTMLVRKLEGENHLGNIDVDGRIIRNCMYHKGTGSVDVDWIHPTRDTFQWRAVVIALMNFRFQ
jgi:hypothetical protein